ncbi:hypothetical protein AC578_6515 [Pseudocercospora eumusae]|uniref:BTB domain-containing protein n=1 Tax=Pseudocercospora eumusae TaxID=321146 RepID=A0A139HHV5_9PEZI|nr:hypothetical protein AC578_6515 [Pseudocercospora eumusae]
MANTTRTSSCAPSSVRVYIWEAGARNFVEEVSHDKLDQYSRAFFVYFSFRPALDGHKREITLPERFANQDALRIVLRAIKQYKPARDTHLIRLVNAIDTSTRCLIWHAARKLYIQPPTAELSLRNSIAYRISHEKVTPDSMTKIYEVFRPHHPELTPYRTMVHQYVYYLIRNMYDSREEVEELARIVDLLPGLREDVDEKLQVEQPKYNQYLHHQRINQKRREEGAAKRREQQK